MKDDSHPVEVFRPYDLKVNTVSENQKELTLDEYYTISAHGIVHVFTLKGKKGKYNSFHEFIMNFYGSFFWRKLLLFKVSY